MTTRARKPPKPPALWTTKMLADDLGLPIRTAETIFDRIAFDYNALVRPAGVRRRFITLEGYEAWRRASGLPQSGSGSS